MKITDEQAAKILRELVASVRDVSSNEEEFKAAIAVIGFEQGIKCRIANIDLEHQLKEAREQRDAARRVAASAEPFLRTMAKHAPEWFDAQDKSELLALIRSAEDLRAWEFEGGNVPRFEAPKASTPKTPPPPPA